MINDKELKLEFKMTCPGQNSDNWKVKELGFNKQTWGPFKNCYESEFVSYCLMIDGTIKITVLDSN